MDDLGCYNEGVIKYEKLVKKKWSRSPIRKDNYKFKSQELKHLSTREERNQARFRQ